MRWIIALAAGALVFPTAVLASDIGQIKTVKGAAHIERSGKKLPAAAGMQVRQADTVVTGADGTVGITFLDNSLFSAGPNSVLALDRYRFDSTTHAGEFEASLKKGSVAVVSGKMVKQSPESLRIRTPTGIMGARGTEFVVKVSE
jgi:hypothetical protein